MGMIDVVTVTCVALVSCVPNQVSVWALPAFHTSGPTTRLYGLLASSATVTSADTLLMNTDTVTTSTSPACVAASGAVQLAVLSQSALCVCTNSIGPGHSRA